MANQELGYVPWKYTCVPWHSINSQPCVHSCPAFLVWLMLSINDYTQMRGVSKIVSAHVGRAGGPHSVFCLTDSRSISTELLELSTNHPHESSMERACTISGMQINSHCRRHLLFICFLPSYPWGPIPLSHQSCDA